MASNKVTQASLLTLLSSPIGNTPTPTNQKIRNETTTTTTTCTERTQNNNTDTKQLEERIKREPANVDLYEEGGAYPEIHVAQYPFGKPPDDDAGRLAEVLLQTGMTMTQLQCAAGRAALANKPEPARPTEEWITACAYLQKHADDVQAGMKTLGRGRVPAVRRVAAVDAESVLYDVLKGSTGEGVPVVVSDGFHDWPAFAGNDNVPYTPWTFDNLVHARAAGSGDNIVDSAESLPSSMSVVDSGHDELPPIMANDRAPARHRDKNVDGRPQIVAMTDLSDFVQYVMERDSPRRLSAAEKQARDAITSKPLTDVTAAACRESSDPPSTGAPPPFYLNGWRAFSESAAMRDACPSPYFSAVVDHNRVIMSEVSKAISAKMQQPEMRDVFMDWAETSERALTKVFTGPRHTITRLHFDAGGAHAWLGQVVGRKWIVLYPPSDAEHLSVLSTEKETVQSAVDPLREALRADQALASSSKDWSAWLRNHPPHAREDVDSLTYHAKANPVQTVLHPGEAIIVPKGWWHYALSLDPSITVMRNFYEQNTNINDCVKMVTQQLATAIAKVKR